jgi:hypothetical protein
MDTTMRRCQNCGRPAVVRVTRLPRSLAPIMKYILIKTISGALVLSLAILYTGCSNERSAMTSEERAFAEQWNQWVDDHPKEINDLRTRAIADNMTKEEISREMIGLMVRFSNEANLDIPQRFIDDLKKGEASPNTK